MNFTRHFIFFAFIITVSACMPEEEIVKESIGGMLTFSEDTVTFDTILTSRGSITKRLIVRNNSKNAVVLDNIFVAGSPTTPYDIILNGKKGKEFTKIRLLGNDSLMVLVSVNINPADKNTPYLIKDSIQFTAGNNAQNVKLVAWGQDAHYIKRQHIRENTVFTADRPYVLSDTILVDSLAELKIEKGAKIYFDNNAILYVRGTLTILGEAEHKVHLRYFRTEEYFESSYNQWQGIIFIPGSKKNQIRHAIIENSFYGLWVYTPDNDTIPDIEISHSTINHIGAIGLFSINSDIVATNTLFSNCLINCVRNAGGGNYYYQHCTMVNYPYKAIRKTPVTSFSDHIALDGIGVIENDMNLQIINSIIWGSLPEEIEISTRKNVFFYLSVFNNLLKTQISEFDTNGNIINTDPKFKDHSVFDFKIDSLSPAKNKGLITEILDDHDGKQRDAQPDMGAFEQIE